MHNQASGPGAITDDGCAVELYRRLKSDGEPEIIHAAIPAGATILELGAGAGRVTHPLIALGHRVTAVDSSAAMLAHVTGAETVVAGIETLDLARTFDAVVLGSTLINVPDDALRGAFLATCRRHVADDGVVLIERHTPSGVASVREGLLEEADGIRCSLRDIRRDGTNFTATIVYEAPDATWTQSFSATILDDDAVAGALRAAGLRFTGWLDERKGWLSAATLR